METCDGPLFLFPVLDDGEQRYRPIAALLYYCGCCEEVFVGALDAAHELTQVFAGLAG